ncbi:MAG: hypothetical protein E6G50_12810 [Actinobacteria bacterium]|nr:MAG: hypothetical protein E6G50_12810 [Actinomycetota bacterium]
MFDCVAEFDAGAYTALPLFWETPPPPPHGLQALCPQPFATATFGPLTTTGAEYALWSAELLPELDWSADCETSPPCLWQQRPLPATVWL